MAQKTRTAEVKGKKSKRPQEATKAKIETAKPNSMPASAKDVLFSRAQLKDMLQATSKQYYSRYQGFPDQPQLGLSERFDLLCKYQGWELQHHQKHLHRFLALAIATKAPGLIDHVFENKFGNGYLSSFGKMPAHSRACSASARFKAVALSQNWSEGGKTYQQRYKSFRTCFFSDCALAIKAHFGISQVLALVDPEGAGGVRQTSRSLDFSSSCSDNPSSYAATSDCDKSLGPAPLVAAQKLPSSPADTLALQFDKLAIENQWKNGSKAFYKHRGQFFRERFEDEWNEIIYTSGESDDEDDDSQHGVSIGKAAQLAQWQNLCHELGVDPVPHSITQCKKELKTVYVNIIDLMEARHRNSTEGDCTVTVRRFPSARALAKYTRYEDKIFSKGAAKRQGALRALLVHVFVPPPKKQTL